MKTPLRIVHLEDDLNDVELVRSMLEAEGMACEVKPVMSRAHFIDALEKGGFDIIFADYTLPSFDGMTALTIAKEKCPDIPFIFVTGTLGEEKAIESMKNGAIDYVLKQKISRLAPSVQRAINEVKEKNERLQAEKALQKSEERYRRITGAITDYIYTVRVEAGKSVETKHGEACFAVTGYSIEDFTADPYLWIRMIPEEDRELVCKQNEQVLSGLSSQPIEHRIVRKDGVVRWVESSIVPHIDANGNLILYDGIVRDISERKEAEDSVRKSEERYGLAIRGTSDGLWDWDIIANEVWLAPRFKEQLGYQDDELVSSFETWEMLLHSDDKESTFEAIRRHLENREPYIIEYRLKQKSGEYRWFMARGQAMWNEDGKPFRMSGSIQDITDRKEAERQVVRKNKVLDAINRVFRDAITCETEEELGKTCLAVAEELSGSRFGFFGELNKDGLFVTLAISNPGWDACSMAVSDARKYLESMPVRGVDRATMRDGKSRIVNGEDAFAKHPDHVPVPEGHPRLTGYLGVPLKQEGKTIGMVGLANKEGGYTLEDQENIEALSAAMVEALKSKRAEERLQKSEERFRLLVEGVKDYAIFMLDPEGHVVSWNEGAKRITEYNESEVIGCHLSRFYPEEDIQEGKPDRELETALAEGRFEDEGWHVRKDGSKFIGNFVITALKDEAGKLRGYSRVTRDVTERNKVAKELQQHRAHLEELIVERTGKLMKEISEREKVEKELRMNMEELERFSRMALGREQQMIRLKQEVNEYMSELGRHTKYKIVE